jgi:hypothetical protein
VECDEYVQVEVVGGGRGKAWSAGYTHHQPQHSPSVIIMAASSTFPFTS